MPNIRSEVNQYGVSHPNAVLTYYAPIQHPGLRLQQYQVRSVCCSSPCCLPLTVCVLGIAVQAVPEVAGESVSYSHDVQGRCVFTNV